jgi:hypothetical protein
VAAQQAAAVTTDSAHGHITHQRSFCCAPHMLPVRQVVLQRRNVCFLVYFSLFCASCTDDRHARP